MLMLTAAAAQGQDAALSAEEPLRWSPLSASELSRWLRACVATCEQQEDASSVGLRTYVRGVVHTSQDALSAASPQQLLEILAALLRLEELQPETEAQQQDSVLLLDSEWLPSLLDKMAAGARELSAPAAAEAILAASSALSASPPPPEWNHAAWADTMLRRMSDAGVEAMSSADLALCAYALATSFQHVPPPAWLEAVFGDRQGAAGYRADLAPDEAAALASASACFRCVPHLLLAKQVYFQTIDGMSSLPTRLLVELVWAVGAWQASKAGASARWDYRPPSSWWIEFFQATAPGLQKDLSPACGVRLVWAAAMLELRPPLQWLLQLVGAMRLRLQAGQLAPWELLYLTKAADRWWSQMTDSREALVAANARAPPPTALDERAGAAPGSSSSSAASGAASSSAASAPRTVVMCGSTDAYAPPMELSLLISEAFAALQQAQVPAHWQALDVSCPPYTLGMDVELPLPESDAQGGGAPARAGAGLQLWQLTSAAARQVFGPTQPPPF